MKDYPLVSIVIPVYNGANFLAEAIDSALAQTYPNVEVIVVNDGSKDDGATEAIALSYGDRIRYFSKENGGVSSALNLGIEKMRGEYFSWLSHDDKYTPTKLESHFAKMTADNKNCIFRCGSAFIDADSNPMDRKSRKMEPGFYAYDKMLSEIFAGKMPNGCALLIPKSCFDRFGKFDTTLRYIQDADMWYRILAGRVDFVCHTEDVGVLSRVHGQQVTVTSKHLYKKEMTEVGPRMIERLTALPDDKQYLLKKYMLLCCRENDIQTSKRIYDLLKERKMLSLTDKIKYFAIQEYGKLRPFLVRCYYKLCFRIQVKR